MSHMASVIGLNKISAKTDFKNIVAEQRSHVPLLWLFLFRSTGSEIPVVERKDARTLLGERTEWLCKNHPAPDIVKESAKKLDELLSSLRWRYLQLEFSDLCNGRFEKYLAEAVASLEQPTSKSLRQLTRVCLDEAFNKSANNDILIGYSSSWYPPKVKSTRKPKPASGPKGWKFEKLSKKTRYCWHCKAKTWPEVETAMKQIWIDFLQHVEAFEPLEWDKIFMSCEPVTGCVTFRVDSRDHFRTAFPIDRSRYEFQVTFDIVKQEFEQVPEYKDRGYSYHNAIGRIHKKILNAIKMATSDREVRTVIQQLNKQRKRSAYFNVNVVHYYSGISDVVIPARQVSQKVE